MVFHLCLTSMKLQMSNFYRHDPLLILACETLIPLRNQQKLIPPLFQVLQHNDVLPTIEYQRFKSLRKFAKNIGFKYVWHKDGKFLARWNNNGQAHFFNNLSDLNIIKSTYTKLYPHILLTLLLLQQHPWNLA